MKEYLKAVINGRGAQYLQAAGITAALLLSTMNAEAKGDLKSFKPAKVQSKAKNLYPAVEPDLPLILNDPFQHELSSDRLVLIDGADDSRKSVEIVKTEVPEVINTVSPVPDSSETTVFTASNEVISEIKPPKILQKKQDYSDELMFSGLTLLGAIGIVQSLKNVKMPPAPTARQMKNFIRGKGR